MSVHGNCLDNGDGDDKLGQLSSYNDRYCGEMENLFLMNKQKKSPQFDAN